MTKAMIFVISSVSTVKMFSGFAISCAACDACSLLAVEARNANGRSLFCGFFFAFSAISFRRKRGYAVVGVDS